MGFKLCMSNCTGPGSDEINFIHSSQYTDVSLILA